MTARRHDNPGKREREAGKRHRRARIWSSSMGADTAPLKLGSEHLRRWCRRCTLAVADAEKLANGVEESSTQHLAGIKPGQRVSRLM